MKRMAWISGAGLTLLVLLGADGPDSDPMLADLGAQQFATHCASCHGTEGRGDGPVAPALVVKPADLTRIAARRGGTFPAAEVARFIDGRFEVTAHGPREMPVWGRRFSEGVPEAGVGEEIARGKILSLVEYLRSIQRGP